MPKYQMIAGIAGTFTLLALSNLIHRVYITKNTEHLTFAWIFFILTAQTLLMIYGLLNNSYGIYLPASIVVIGVSYILYVKLTNTIENKGEKELINY